MSLLRSPKRLALVALIAFSAVVSSPTIADATKADKQYQKPIKMLIGAIRYSKDDLALKMLSIDKMSAEVNKDHWAKMTPAQRKEFSKGLGTLIRKLSFPKARDIFKHLDAVLYGKAEVKGALATIKTTIVIHRAYKKKELVITWTLAKAKKKSWKILDTKTVGESTLKGIREAQTNPLVKEGGVELLMKTLRQKLASVK